MPTVLAALVAILGLFIIFMLAKTVKIIPQARAGIVERFGALSADSRPGPEDGRALRRPGALSDRPA
jgi:regulator of protease activity HflC (stomatin/prohibitin superfamily)